MKKKTMNISFTGIKKILTNRFVAITVAGLMFAPTAAFCQDEEGAAAPSGQELRVESDPASGGSGIWHNSSGSTVGTQDNAGTNFTPVAVKPATSATAGANTRPNGSTTDGRDPGGNPDVPFDGNMNIAFLILGAVFSFFVVRRHRKFTMAPVAVK